MRMLTKEDVPEYSSTMLVYTLLSLLAKGRSNHPGIDRHDEQKPPNLGEPTSI